MRIIFFIFSLVIYTSSYSQTYSKLLEPFDLIDNIMMDMEMQDDAILMVTRHRCDLDSTDNVVTGCLGLSKVSLDGEIGKSVLLDSLLSVGFNILSIFNEKILVAGHTGIAEGKRDIQLYEFDNNLNHIASYQTNMQSGNFLLNNGMLINPLDNSLLLFSQLWDTSNNFSNIIRFSSDIVETDSYSALRNSGDNDCNDLQFTSEGNLIYANPFNSGVGASAVRAQQIMVIDSAFNKIDSLEFDSFIQDRSGELRLLASSTGHVYCMTNRNPEGSVSPSHGHINKLSANLDTLLWTVKLPFNNLINERRYRIHDFEEAKNGDILACGRTWDASPNALQDQINNTFNGFLIRLSREGEIKYLRVFKLPHKQQEILPPGEFGIYHESSLWNIHELVDGRLILGGTATYGSAQIGQIIINEETQSFSWLMTVDENGCLDQEECQEVIEIDGEKRNASPIFPIGTRWTYEYFPETINPVNRQHSYIEYEITDTVRQNELLTYVIENNRGLPEERMIQGDNEVYFWDNNLSDWQLSYDFDAVSSYETQFGTPNFVTNTVVEIDTVEYFTFGERGIVNVDKVLIENNGTIEEPLSLAILERCGNLEGGLRLGLGQNLFDPFFQIGELRCFEQDSFFYNFNGLDKIPIPCDSTWVEVLNNVEDQLGSEIKVYPNPTFGMVYFDGIDVQSTAYQLYSIDGQIISSGILKENHIQIENKGVFVLKLFQNGKLYTTEIIRL